MSGERERGEEKKIGEYPIIVLEGFIRYFCASMES